MDLLQHKFSILLPAFHRLELLCLLLTLLHLLSNVTGLFQAVTGLIFFNHYFTEFFSPLKFISPILLFYNLIFFLSTTIIQC